MEKQKETKQTNKSMVGSGAGNSLQVGDIVLYSDYLDMDELMNAFVNLISHEEVKKYLIGFNNKKKNAGASYVE